MTESKTKITKTNTQMAFITVEDPYGQFEAVVFRGYLKGQTASGPGLKDIHHRPYQHRTG